MKRQKGGMQVINFYNVFERGKYVTVVKALSEKDACKQVYMKKVSASRNIEKCLEDYKAEKVRLS